MSFLHPWAIGIGLCAVALPIVIHFLTKPRPVRLPLSTLRFVREAIHQRRARHRLRDFIILSLRMLAIFLIAWAISRPLLGEKPLVSPSESSAAARVVILDCSQSMGATASGIQLFERARSVAASYLGDQPSVQGNLLLAGASSRPVFERLSANFASMRQELATATVRPERLQVQAALNQAAEFLSKVPMEAGRKRELVIVSDFQRASWAAADFSPLPQDTVIQLESVAAKEPLANLAILRVGVPGRIEQGREVRLEVEVGNYSPTARQAQVEIVLGAAVYRVQGLCPPGMKTTLTTEIATQATGWQSGQARLLDVQDALAADNTRPFVLEVRPHPNFVLLTRQPPGRKPSSSYLLETALFPSLAADKKDERLKRLDPGQPDRDLLTAADVIVIDHPGKLAQETIQLLASLLRRGRGILYIAAENVDATNLQLLKQAAGTDLQMPVEFQPPPPGQVRRNQFLAEVKRDQPPFNAFGDELNAVTRLLRFSGGLASRRVEGGLSDDILASYTDRSICLVVTACGGGTLAVLNADLSASNLAKERPFVTILGELVSRLMGRSRAGDAWSAGEPLAVYLPTTAGPPQGLLIASPPATGNPDYQSSGSGELREESNGVLWRMSHAGSPGIYQVLRGGSTVFALATGIPAEESDLRPLEPIVLKERLAGGRAVAFHAVGGAEEEPHDDFWVWLAVGCVLCLLGELLALKWFKT